MNLSDRELLARTLQAEAGNQGLSGMLAAGSVIMNRANTSGYGNGVRGVILKPGQFSAWNSLTGYAGGEQGQDMGNMRASTDAYAVADRLLAGEYADPTGGATHYYNPAISQPKWGGGDRWKRIGDHVFGSADAGRGGQTPQITTSTKGPQMMQEQKPQGLLGSLGIQKIEEGAEGETGQRFYNRDSFKDTAAILAQGFGRMGIMGMEEIADNIAKQRTENKARNKTAEYLRKAGRGDLADMVDQGMIGGKEAAGVLLQKPEDDRTAAMQNFAEYNRIAAEQGQEAANQFLEMTRKGSVTNVNMPNAVNAEEKLREKLMGGVGENFASYRNAGAASAAALQDLNVLQELAPLAPSGPLEGRFAEAFPEFNDVAALRQSIVKRVAPTLRVEGSGATSDLEFNAMLNSLGSLRNTPEANQAIIGVMQEKARYNMQRRKIIDDYMTGDGVTLKQTNERLAALDQGSSIPQSTRLILDRYSTGGRTPSGGAGAPEVGTISEGYRFKGGNPADQNNWEKI
jgi:hypothetical protein